MSAAKGYAAPAAKAPLAPFHFERRDLRARDVAVQILYCGICHSDLHQARDEWGGAIFPMVPGHEIVGRVTKVGSEVKKFTIGAMVGVGCMVDSCRTCEPCREGLEQFCQQGAVLTYNSRDKQGEVMYGGYSDHIVVDEAFVLRIRHQQDQLAAVAPLLCAGITTYSPLRHWKAGPGKRVGIVGLGGLGHVGLKLAHSFGAETVLFTSSERKKDDAKRLGADEVIVTKDRDAMARQRGSFDFILDTVAATHDLDSLLATLRIDGTLTLVGAPDHPHSVSAFPLVMGRRSLAGSLIGGIAETQEMLDYCAQHGITAEIEKIPIQQVNEAYDRLGRSDVRYRFVIDLASLK